MTFYWWSHWFWITLLSLLLLSFGSTHPSQELNAASSEYNQNSRGAVAKSAVTKLYQASEAAELVLGSSTPVSTLSDAGNEDEAAGVTSERTKLLSIIAPADEEEGSAEGVPDSGAGTAEAVDATEYKRSADTYNNNRTKDVTADDTAVPQRADEEPSQLEGKTLNNYTNFSSSGADSLADDHNDSAKAEPAPPAAPQIAGVGDAVDSDAAGTAEWINAAMLNDSVTNNNNNSNSSPITTTATTTNTTTSAGSGVSPSGPVGERAPFTLENANKEEELRRAESEQRNARKSKGLSASAEYKHSNRFINFSSDGKQLQARSAAATASNSDYEAEESNISSEALAVQRTYFLDAGAISAICFTVFGVCCAVGTLGIVLYRRRYSNKPQALSEPDSSVYIDDSTMRVSDNSDEMYSLDNDSFLNSLEAMTIQNYWTDTVKHTKL